MAKDTSTTDVALMSGLHPSKKQLAARKTEQHFPKPIRLARAEDASEVWAKGNPGIQAPRNKAPAVNAPALRLAAPMNLPQKAPRCEAAIPAKKAKAVKENKALKSRTDPQPRTVPGYAPPKLRAPGVSVVASKDWIARPGATSVVKKPVKHKVEKKAKTTVTIDDDGFIKVTGKKKHNNNDASDKTCFASSLSGNIYNDPGNRYAGFEDSVTSVQLNNNGKKKSKSKSRGKGKKLSAFTDTGFFLEAKLPTTNKKPSSAHVISTVTSNKSAEEAAFEQDLVSAKKRSLEDLAKSSAAAVANTKTPQNNKGCKRTTQSLQQVKAIAPVSTAGDSGFTTVPRKAHMSKNVTEEKTSSFQPAVPKGTMASGVSKPLTTLECSTDTSKLPAPKAQLPASLSKQFPSLTGTSSSTTTVPTKIAASNQSWVAIASPSSSQSASSQTSRNVSRRNSSSSSATAVSTASVSLKPVTYKEQFPLGGLAPPKTHVAPPALTSSFAATTISPPKIPASEEVIPFFKAKQPKRAKKNGKGKGVKTSA
ncbi:hypothetical protein BDV96DRAFT_647083 [Lophiotrema nucula]|uniref:Uncharacterized protein n=1 Tax=Lophiotrema nucula TaxID=690887 RepID=A0A6A5Z4V1_9PLEO|nr:hypothetical protein BDV96DRAFT_647083 [Lophiotrema nucula]